MSNQDDIKFFLAKLDFSGPMQSWVVEAPSVEFALFKANPVFSLDGIQLQWDNIAPKRRSIKLSSPLHWLLMHSSGFPPLDHTTLVCSVEVELADTVYMIYRIK